jgi:glycosyltransferase involved in cell wall biosynthesis
MERGIECRVVSFDGWRPKAGGSGQPARVERSQGVQVLRLSAASQLQALHAFAREWPPDLTHVHHAMLWEALGQLPDATAPTVLSIHVLQQRLYELRGGAERAIHPPSSLVAQQRAIAEATRVLLPSRAVRDAVASYDGVVADKLALLPLALHDSISARAATERRRSDDSAARPLSLLYVGRFGDVKGTRELFELIPALLARLPEARFVVAGGLPDNRKADARWRRRAEAALGAVAERVELCGWLDPADLEARYSAADLLLSPSWHESFGLAPLEAMLHGVPVLATRSGGPEELLDDGVSGVLVPPRDVSAMLEAAVTLASDRPRLAAMGLAAQKRARADFLWPARVGELEQLYGSLLSRA